MRLIRQARSGWREFGFFAMALLIHGALLLLPMKTWQAHPPDGNSRNELIQVNLRPAPRMPASPLEPARALHTPVKVLAQPLLERKPAADYILAEIPLPSPMPELENQAASESPPVQVLSSEQLRFQAGQLARLAPPAQTGSSLGTAKPMAPPANWSQHAGAPIFSSFEDRSHEVTLPETATVVDRWQAADGSHQVIVHIPNGDSLCGRADAYNPMQPLVEQVMMFQPCGRKPTFTMPERYKKGS